MLIEQSAYANRWRRVTPAAKAGFALAGLVAAFAATTPGNALLVALLLAATTLGGAGVAPGRYLRVALPAIGFLALSCLSLAFSVSLDAQGHPAWQLAPETLPAIGLLAARSLAALAALLGLVLTTPLPDLLALLRRLHAPEVLLDLMVLCYRMLFVLRSAIRDTRVAQRARLGYGDTRRSLRSLALLVANLAIQVWQRAACLHRAALARNGDGPLRFLTPEYPQARRHQWLALGAGAGLILAARLGA
mgnify:CR=1 FL=1